MAKYPLLALDGNPDKFEKYLPYFIDGGYFIVNYDSTFYSFDDYLHRVFSLLQYSGNKQPGVLVGGWLTDQLVRCEMGDELTNPIAGRVLERIYARYGIQRALIIPDHDEPIDESDAIALAISGNPISMDYEPDFFDGHDSYIGHLMAHRVNNLPGWSIIKDISNLDDAIRYNRAYRNRQPPWVHEKKTSWYGTIDPRLIIVGDRYNPVKANYPYPFAKNIYSSVFLNMAINLAGLQEHYMAWVNINDAGGPDHIIRLFARYIQTGNTVLYPPPVVVALGNLAWQKLNSMGIQSILVPHPQYVSRFHHSRLMSYADVFRQFAYLN